MSVQTPNPNVSIASIRKQTERERAKLALDYVKGLESKSAKVQHRYRVLLVKLPARLHANGLGQTVAFYLSAGEKSPEHDVVDLIGKSLLKAEPPASGRSLMEAITMGSPEDYRSLSANARSLANWLKRFAEAFLAGKEAEEAGHGTT